MNTKQEHPGFSNDHRKVEDERPGIIGSSAASVPEDGTLLPLMEAFYTIQGEGFNTGKAAYFIRLGGCDVGCHWCDVKESWDASLHPLTATDQIVEQAAAHPANTVVVTGGEDRQSVVSGNSVSVRVDLGVRRFIHTKTTHNLAANSL